LARREKITFAKVAKDFRAKFPQYELVYFLPAGFAEIKVWIDRSGNRHGLIEEFIYNYDTKELREA